MHFAGTFAKLTFLLCAALITPVAAIDRMEFWAELTKPTPAWMREQIEQDLKPFTHQLSKTNLDALFADENHMCIRIRVVDGQMIIEKSPNTKEHIVVVNYDPHFFKIHELIPLPDLDILVSLHDHLGEATGLPIFILSKSNRVEGSILLPDWFALAGYETDKSLVLKGCTKYPWEKKKDLMFFRGSDTGVESLVNFDSWKQSPRPKLVALSLQYPHLINARFAKTLHHKQFLDQAKAEGFIGDFITMDEYMGYKYLIDLDGNCASAPRLGLILHSNCIPFKAITHSVQWFYKTLHAWEHYIPIKDDLSDLLAQLEWAKSHPKEAQQISKNARHLAKEVLSQKAIYTYLYKLLVEYAHRQRAFYHL
jgi:hypothetical protein